MLFTLLLIEIANTTILYFTIFMIKKTITNHNTTHKEHILLDARYLLATIQREQVLNSFFICLQLLDLIFEMQQNPEKMKRLYNYFLGTPKLNN